MALSMDVHHRVEGFTAAAVAGAHAVHGLVADELIPVVEGQ